MQDTAWRVDHYRICRHTMGLSIFRRIRDCWHYPQSYPQHRFHFSSCTSNYPTRQAAQAETTTFTFHTWHERRSTLVRSAQRKVEMARRRAMEGSNITNGSHWCCHSRFFQQPTSSRAVPTSTCSSSDTPSTTAHALSSAHAATSQQYSSPRLLLRPH